jgi:hypothetical protein
MTGATDDPATVTDARLNHSISPTAPKIGTKSMTDTSVDDDRTPDRRTTERVRVIEAELSAHGLTTHITDARAGLDLTATFSPSRQREPEFWIDEDGYAELRYYNRPDVAPAEIAATALRALKAITSMTQDSSQPGS